MILSQWTHCTLTKNQVRRLVPSINPGTLARYLDGDRTVFLRERTAEFLLYVVANAPRGAKPASTRITTKAKP
jgi:hypothetical protein